MKKLFMIVLLLVSANAFSQQEIKDYNNTKKAANIHTAFAGSILVLYVIDEDKDPTVKNILIFSTLTAIIMHLNAVHQKIKYVKQNTSSEKVE